MRLRMGERHAGRKHKGSDLCPIELARILNLYFCGPCFGGLTCIVVKSENVGTALFKSAGGQKTGTAQPEDRDLPFCKRGDRNHLNFRVARPASASTTAT